MRLLGREVLLYPEPGPLDEREISWRGEDLFRLFGSYVVYTILAMIALMMLPVLRDEANRQTVVELTDMLAIAALFYSHSRHHFWPNAAYWRLRLQDFRQHWKQGVLWGIGAQLGGTLIRLACAFVASAFGSNLSEVKSNNPLVGMNLGFSWLLIAIGVVVLAPLTEELFMRGMLHGLLRKRFGVAIGLLISSLVFAMAHVSLLGFVGFLCIGLAFGLLYERTGSLAPCMIAHATHNLISVGLALLFL